MPSRATPPSAQPCGACSGPGELFSVLTEPERRQLRRLRIERDCRRGQVLFYQGEELPHLVCIQRGYVKLIKTDSQGREIVIRFLGPGEVTGFRPLLAGEPSAAAAECVTDARLCLLPRALFLHLAEECRPFARLLMSKLARELRESEERWLSRAGETAERRVSRFLAQLAGAESVRERPGPVWVDVPKGEIARAADVTVSTLSRVLARLAGRGLLRLEPRRIVLLQPARLADPVD